MHGPMSAHAPRAARTGDARARAAEALARVERDGAFAAAVLDAALDRAPMLDPRDRGLATELVYGVLRTAPALDAALGRFARDGLRSIAALDPFARAVLRVGAYQVMALARVPPRAAVHAAVESLKQSRSPGLAGFANALLRKLAAERPAELPEDARVTLALAAVPPGVTARLAEVLGADGARSFLTAALGATPGVTLRVTPARIHREALRERLVTELAGGFPGATVDLGAVSPLALRVTGGGDPTRTPSWAEGFYGLQEEGAQAVALSAEVRPGMRVLDACAGRGGKSAVAAVGLAGDGLLHAVDLFPEKLMRMREELARVGLHRGITLGTYGADLSRGLGALGTAAPPGGYDVVMVDAPCSGLGTLGRRPDLLGRLRDDAGWAALADLQAVILGRVATQVAPGGVLVYAVCTVTRAEGDGVVGRFVTEHTEFTPAEGSTALPGRLRPARVILRPDEDGTDGFMVYRFRRTG